MNVNGLRTQKERKKERKKEKKREREMMGRSKGKFVAFPDPRLRLFKALVINIVFPMLAPRC